MSYFPTEVKPTGLDAYARRVSRVAKQKAQAAVVPPARSEREDSRDDGSAERLGNNTKLQAALEVREHDNPDCIQRFRLDDARREYVEVVSPEAKQITARQARFAAQSSAAKLLHSVPNPRAAKHDVAEWEEDDVASPKPAQWRVTGCSRRKIAEEVAVLHSPSIKKAHFGNLMICGSVWTCPVCSAKVSEARKQEIKVATDLHAEAGGFMYMVSMTFSHQRNDLIVPMLGKFAQARTWMRQHRVFKQLRREMGFVGDIRALEVTYGDKNGWHPHEHGLWLVADRLSRDKLRSMMNTLFTLWHAACRKAGLALPNRKRGVNIIECHSAADYMAKCGREETWGISSELSKQHVKTGKADRMTPFDLLRSYEAGNKQHGALFIEYAKAFFGKQQIRWSKGLKAIFGIAIREDQELAEEVISEDAAVMFTITAYEWRVVLHQPYDVRSQVLLLAELGGTDAARSYIERLCFRSELLPF